MNTWDNSPMVTAVCLLAGYAAERSRGFGLQAFIHTSESHELGEPLSAQVFGESEIFFCILLFLIISQTCCRSSHGQSGRRMDICNNIFLCQCNLKIL